jgi:hypothetical protein
MPYEPVVHFLAVRSLPLRQHACYYYQAFVELTMIDCSRSDYSTMFAHQQPSDFLCDLLAADLHCC